MKFQRILHMAPHFQTCTPQVKRFKMFGSTVTEATWQMMSPYRVVSEGTHFASSSYAMVLCIFYRCSTHFHRQKLNFCTFLSPRFCFFQLSAITLQVPPSSQLLSFGIGLVCAGHWQLCMCASYDSRKAKSRSPFNCLFHSVSAFVTGFLSCL